MNEPESPPSIRMSSTSPVGQLRPIAAVKIAQVAALVLFAVLVPRLMGPDLYGQFAVILSVFTLWRMSCTIGGRYIFGRYVPKYSASGEPDRIRAVFMHVLGARALVVLVASPLLFLFLRRVLPGVSDLTLVASTGAFVATMLAGPMFNVYFGLNRLGLAMTSDPLGRFLLLMLLVLFGGTSDLERASLALIAAQSFVLMIGVVLARRFFRVDGSLFDLPSMVEHVGFGLVVYSANLLLRFPWRLGESALALSGVDSAEIAFFSVAVTATLAFTRILGSVTTVMIPSLGILQSSSDFASRDQSMGVALRYLLVAAFLYVPFIVAAAPQAVVLLLGDSFLDVLPHMYVLSAAVVAVPVLRTALAFAVVIGRVRLNLQLGVVAMATFGVVALFTIPRLGPVGASVAVATAIGAASVAGALQIRGAGVLREAKLPTQLALAAVCSLPMIVYGLRSLPAIFSAILFAGASVLLGTVQRAELATLLRESRLLPFRKRAS